MSHMINSKEHGLSMIELLIALAISSFLILGIIQIYIDNKRNYLFQQTQAANQENLRFLDLLLSQYINKAGFRRSPLQDPVVAFPAETVGGDTGCVFKSEQSIVPTKDHTGICIRYYPLLANELDCTGSTPTLSAGASPFESSGSHIVMILRYNAANDLNGTLTCQVDNRSAEIVTGIADFRFNFGISMSADRQVDKLVAINDNQAKEKRIMQVNYSALMASGNNVRSSTDSIALTNWKTDTTTAELARLTTGDKGQIFQIASNTFTLRNQMP